MLAPFRSQRQTEPTHRTARRNRPPVRRRPVGRLESLEGRALLSASLQRDPMLTDPMPAAFASFESEAQLDQYLVDTAVQRYQHLFGQPGWGGWWDCPVCRVAPGMDWALSSGMGPTADHSQTNVQVAGVDEGDLVETDGTHLFMISDNVLTMIDVSTAATPQVVWSRTWEGTERPDSLYLHDGRLTVVSQSYGMWIQPAILNPGVAQVADLVMFPGPIGPVEPPHVTLTVYDVAQGDVAQGDVPQELYHTEFEGSLVSSRSIEGEVYLVLQQDLNLPAPRLLEVPTPPGDPTLPPSTDVVATTSFVDARMAWPIPDGKSYVYETEASYRAWLADQELDVFPSYTTYNASGQVTHTGHLTSATSLVREKGVDPYQVLSVASLDSHGVTGTPEHATALMTSYGGQVYMTSNALYVLRGQWDNQGAATEMVKFSIDATTGDLAPAAVGRVAGSLLNRFSADEHEGYFRIATTQGWGETASNHLYVLDQVGDQLTTVGVVEIMRGETLFSARFLGDEAYVVTFLRTDPLFRIDLSNPTAPRVVGELVIPGFSDYLHPVAEGYLVGVGRDADPTTGRVAGLQVSLFDVRADQPVLVSRYLLTDTNQSWSDATFDPHAFAYYPEQGVLALPVSSYTVDPIQPWNWTYQPTHSLFVLDVDVATGLQLLGKMGDVEPIVRNVRIGANLLALSAHQLTIAPLLQPGAVLAQLQYRPTVPVVIDVTKSDVDTVGNTVDSAAVLTMDESTYVSSGLEVAGDADVYRMAIPQDGKLTLNAKFDGAAALRVTLLDINQLTMAIHEFSSNGEVEIDLSQLDHDQMYVSVVASDLAATGTYALSFQATPAADGLDPNKLQGAAGDLNGDGAVDAADVDLLFRDWGSSSPDRMLGDLNGDRMVDAADAALLFENWTGDSL